MGFDETAGTGFSTMRGRNYPAIRQFTVFLENRCGQLLEVVRKFEGSNVHIVALSIVDSSECAFVRVLLSHQTHLWNPERAMPLAVRTN